MFTYKILTSDLLQKLQTGGASFPDVLHIQPALTQDRDGFFCH